MNCFAVCAAGKGFWSEMLGVGDFYYELGVQIIEVCLALKHRNGGKFCLFKSVTFYKINMIEIMGLC